MTFTLVFKKKEWFIYKLCEWWCNCLVCFLSNLCSSTDTKWIHLFVQISQIQQLKQQWTDSNYKYYTHKLYSYTGYMNDHVGWTLLFCNHSTLEWKITGTHNTVHEKYKQTLLLYLDLQLIKCLTIIQNQYFVWCFVYILERHLTKFKKCMISWEYMSRSCNEDLYSDFKVFWDKIFVDSNL